MCATRRATCGIAIIADPCIATHYADAQVLQAAIETLQLPCKVYTPSELVASDSVASMLVVPLLEVDNVFIGSISKDDYGTLHTALIRRQSLLWITRDENIWSEPRHHLVDGLGRTLMSEDAARKFTALCLDDPGPLHTAVVDAILTLVKLIVTLPVGRLENNYAVKGSILHINRT
jgi:hypothetical protein